MTDQNLDFQRTIFNQDPTQNCGFDKTSLQRKASVENEMVKGTNNRRPYSLWEKEKGRKQPRKNCNTDQLLPYVFEEISTYIDSLSQQ